MKKLKPLTELKRRPKTLVELFKNPQRWTKSALCNKDGTACCVVGGRNFIEYGVFSTVCAGISNQIDFDALWKKIARTAGINHRKSSIIVWNNDPNLTHSKFLRVLKKAKV